MSKIRILIVEDELIIAEDIRYTLTELGYDVPCIATAYDEAMEMVRLHEPDLLLIDIVLKSSPDGIELARTARSQTDIPVIFLTSHADRGTVERARGVNPDAYIVKPFEKKDLYAAIEIAFSNFMSRKEAGFPPGDRPGPRDGTDARERKEKTPDHMFIKQDHLMVKVRFREIRWIGSDGNYVELHCRDKKYLVRSSLQKFLAGLPKGLFLQTHKSFAVNTEYIESADHNSLYIGRDRIPVGRTFRDSVRKRLRLEL